MNVFVALGTQHAKRMHRTNPKACPALQYLSTLSHERHDFRKNVIELKTYAWILSTTFVWNISHSNMR